MSIKLPTYPFSLIGSLLGLGKQPSDCTGGPLFSSPELFPSALSAKTEKHGSILHREILLVFAILLYMLPRRPVVLTMFELLQNQLKHCLHVCSCLVLPETSSSSYFFRVERCSADIVPVMQCHFETTKRRCSRLSDCKRLLQLKSEMSRFGEESNFI